MEIIKNKNLIKLVSVVVTTKNEQKNILNCLESIKSQTWKYIDLIVVDNNSTDNTKKIAWKYTDKVYNLGPERAAQRNFGLFKVSKGDFLAYFDADMVLSPQLIEACMLKMERTGADGLYIPEIILGKSYLNRVRRFERSFYDGTCIDAIRFFTKRIFTEVGGFDTSTFEQGSVEDWDFDKSVRSKGKVVLLERSGLSYSGEFHLANLIESKGVKYKPSFQGIYHNESDLKLLAYLKKKSYYSKGVEKYIEKWGSDDVDIKKQFGLLYRYWTVFTENNKWRVFFKGAHLLFGLYFLRFLIGLIFLRSKIRNQLNGPLY